MSRSRSYWLVVLLAVVVSGCASGEPVDRPASDTATGPSSAGSDSGGPASTPSREPLTYSEPVAEPKDARGIDACQLITAEQVEQLGLVAESAEQVDLAPGLQTCVWSSAIYPANPVSIQKSTEGAVPVIEAMDLIEDPLLPNEDRIVNGHPAVRAELSDTGTCTIIVAVSDYQGVALTADQPESDPCTTSTRMAEFMLSNLPPLIEE